MTDVKLEDRSKITSAEYNLPSFEEFTKLMESAVRSAVDDFVRGAAGESAYIFLRYGQEFDPAKPLTVNIRMPLGREDDPPIFRANLEREIRDFVDDKCAHGRKLEESERAPIVAVRDKLAELVAYYDERLK